MSISSKPWVPGRCPACNRLLVREGLVRCERCGAELVIAKVSPDTPSPDDLHRAGRRLLSLGHAGATEYSVLFANGRPGRLVLAGDEVVVQDGQGRDGWRITVRHGLPVDAASNRPLDALRLREVMGIVELKPWE